MNHVSDVVLLTFGSVEFRDNRYFGKHQIVNYANGFLDYFDQVTFVGHQSKSEDCHAQFDQDNIDIIFTGLELGEEEHSLNYMELLNTYVDIANMVDEETAVIINSPSILFSPVLPILNRRAGHVSTYFGSDHKQVADIQRQDGGFLGYLYSILTRIQGKYAFEVSDSILVRGDPENYPGRKVYESQPIIDLPESFDTEVTETNLSGNVHLLYVGSIQYRKGIDNLIRAISILREQCKERNFILTIVGDGEHLSNLISLSTKLDVIDSVNFTGWIDCQNELANVYKKSTILIIPSRKAEGQPRVIDEANYYGTPVISTKLDYGDSLRHKENIYFVNKSDPNLLAEGIIDLISSHHLYNKISENGYERGIRFLETSAAEQHSKILLGELNED